MIIGESFRKTYKSKVLNWLFLGSIGAINVILQIGKTYFGLTLESSVIIGICISVGIFLMIFLYFILTTRIKYYLRKKKESLYGEAIIYLKDSFGKIHFLRKDDNLNEETLKNSLAFFCQQLKVFFDKKTKSKCSVSIKVFRNIVNHETAANAKLYNLCRDKDALYRDTDIYKNQNHSVFNNTCFRVVLTKITSGKPPNNLHYINNDLENTKDYQNTSWAIHQKKDVTDNWELPYKSELVVPIIPLESLTDNKYQLIGFICVDSDETEVFHEKYDSALIQGVADGIYDLILKGCFN